MLGTTLSSLIAPLRPGLISRRFSGRDFFNSTW